ncbi:LamG-like jellyroll fold domain-containing protein [Sphingomonas sp. Root241]|uniref:LamG-like jellyroll fold domain-containing protein n=1 Tax=Sphingomonas sp. Root241 TaxID=1736501 RepID=UPI000A6B987C|nr:LamG-like jellyroll fold domain-containing protein [Sphingomonas sp. Root241]
MVEARAGAIAAADPRVRIGMRARVLLALAAATALTPPASAQELLFRASGDKDFAAEVAKGDAQPNFQSGMSIVPDGAHGSAMRWPDDGYLAWRAPGNMLAQRGTLSFFWRSHEPVGEAPFVIFRAGFADHSSWDMAFLRIDWNGHGFDAFVTDANLSRIRVSWRMDALPAPDAWHHIAFGWDETQGVRLFVDGKLVAKDTTRADLDAGLDQFGLAARVLSPHQVQSRYNFTRGSDFDEVRVYDQLLDAPAVAQLAAGAEPAARTPVTLDRAAWLHRFGWDRGAPPLLAAQSTSIRKVEFADAKDLKEWMWKGVDGVAETTWPGVYNRSRLPGRSDYFDLPDWNVYVDGGKAYTLRIPANEAFNRVEIRGAAYGDLAWSADGDSFASLARRPKGVVRSVDDLATRTGGVLRFTNIEQEQPIQEIWAYNITEGAEPKGTYKLAYTVDAGAAADLAGLRDLNRFIAGRYPADERATVIALPAGARSAAPAAGSAAATGAAVRSGSEAPIVHVLIPSGFGPADPGKPIARAWNYGWENSHDGLDGVALDIPALKATPDASGRIALNIRVKDPIWPGRDMIDVSVSVKPGQARTLWLDLRDRILTNDNLYLTIASAAPDFRAQSLDGMNVRLVFKAREAAKAEHVADRFNQVKDNWAFLVEEHTASQREGLYRRLYADIGDLLRVDPDHVEGRRYWADIGYAPEKMPTATIAPAPAGVPEWAWYQLRDLGCVREFVNWWIDNRQVPFGDFGGGLSDDVDLVQQWPGLALMGVEPDKINASLRALTEAVYKHGMMENGLGVLTADELHAYEEGMNADAARLYLNWGEPRSVERMLATVKGLETVILPNAAGHMHFASNWYGARKMYREGPWEWQKPYSWVVTHTPILMGVYNANPSAKRLVTGLVDGLLAHGKQDAAGKWSFPNEINWRSDAERKGDGGGASVPLQSAWAAWRFTGDAKYLAPVTSRIAGGPTLVGEFNENVLTALPEGRQWAAALKDRGDLGRYVQWQESGDTRLLADLHRDATAQKINRMYMMTEGHWWSDRVSMPQEWLQRERLGGIALARNQSYPGHSVSWRFAEPGAAEQVAILVPGATREHFRVIAYNMSDRSQRAEMSTWNVAAGRWTMRAGTQADGSDLGAPSPLELERSAAADLVFAPRATSVFDFTLDQPGGDPSTRPDLGIGVDDVSLKGRALTVIVHSLGSATAPGSTLYLEDSSGRTVASTKIAALAAPTDLMPKTARVRLTVPAGVAVETLRLRLALADGGREVTLRNNVLPLAMVVRR